MNGLLRRLAARAAGSAVLLRSNARLQYGGGSLNWTATAESALATPPGAASRSRQNGGPPLAQPIPSAPDTSIVPTADTGLPDGRDTAAARLSHRTMDRGVHAAPLPQALPPWPRHGVPPDDALSPLAASPGETGVARSAGPAGEVAHVASRPIQAQGAPFMNGPAPFPLRPPVTSAHMEAPGSVALQPVPTPLLPAANAGSAPVAVSPAAVRQPIRPASSATAGWQQRVAPAADEATEVHIHIGRIDVTAMKEAPAPRRRPPQQAPLSLDAYLARRSRA